MDHDSIVKKHAENIMQRVNDTYPRTLNIDVLVDEIGKAIKEATRKHAAWPPVIAIGDLLPSFLEPPFNVTVDNPPEGDFADMITSDHDKSSSNLPCL